jgi:hypothetical protein
VNVAEIKDRETLEVWLKARLIEDAIAIAHLSAARVLPLYFAGPDDIKGSTTFEIGAITVVRSVFTSAVGRVVSDEATLTAAFHANERPYRLQTDSVVSDLGYLSASRYAQFTADYAVRTMARRQPSFAAEGAFAAYRSTSSMRIWAAIRADASALQSGLDPFTLPLWPSTPPEWFTSAEAAMRAYWNQNTAVWSFWQRWWDAATSGDPLPWDLQRDIALIDDAIWHAGPEAVAIKIEEIEEEHRLRRTFNGERIEQNPETGLFRLVPETDLPPDIATYAQRKMAKALAIFGETVSNQYRPLEPALRVIAEALEDRANLPVELFDACASANRLVANMARTHVIPQPDADACISEFVIILRQAGADILANDPKTQDVLTARNGIQGRLSLLEVGEPLRAVAAELATISEGPLVPALPKDAAVASNPNADTDDVNVSSFRLVSRIVRFVARGSKKIGDAVIYTDKFIGALQKIMASPQFERVWAYIVNLFN